MPDALRAIDLIRAYIRQFDEAAAVRFSKRLKDAGDSLAEFPNRGRPASHGTRELVTVPPYILRYQVEGENVIILAIKHSAQLRD